MLVAVFAVNPDGACANAAVAVKNANVPQDNLMFIQGNAGFRRRIAHPCVTELCVDGLRDSMGRSKGGADSIRLGADSALTVRGPRNRPYK